MTPSGGRVLGASVQPVRMSYVVESLMEAYGRRIVSKRLHFEPPRGRDLELEFLALPELLVESVLGNLLSNAIKFSPRGGTLSLAAERRGSLVRISLRDSGAGIPPAVLRGLSADTPVPSSPGSEGEPGQGFGLQLAAEHLQRMDGKLELLKVEVGGTEAVVWLHAA